MIRDLEQWVRLAIARIAARTHVTTDPTCAEHRAPRPCTRLDAASRGVDCGRCWSRRRADILDRILDETQQA